MREDLIDLAAKLRTACNGVAAGAAIGSEELLVEAISRLFKAAREAADALEAAREDAGLWRQAFVNERARLNREHGMSIEQARIHAETDAEIAAIGQARGKGVARG